LRAIAAEDINVEYLYAFVTRERGGAYAVFRVEDNGAALAALRKNDIAVVGAEALG
jgi:hypothetical protein